MQPSDYVAASDGNGEAVRAIVTTQRLVGAATLIVDSVQYWPNKFIATSGTLDITTGLLDENTITVFKGTLTGSIITIDEYAPGYADVGHEVGQVVVLKPSTLWADIVRAYLDDLTAFAEASTQVALVRNEVVGGTKDGSNTLFSIVGEAITGSVELYKNGVRQNPGMGNDYTVSGSTITMAVAPLAGTILLADYATSTSQFTSPTTVGIRTNEAVSGTVNGTNKIFTTIAPYIPGTLEVWVNGLKQIPVTHYVETTPTSGIFTFDDAPLTSDNIIVNYQNSLSFAIGDADTVDTFHASPVAAANSILPLNASAQYPVDVIDNPYKFRAYRSANVAVGDGTSYDIVYNVENFDTNNNFDTTTGKYTVPVTGYYQLNASARITGSTGANWLWHATLNIYSDATIIDNTELYVYDQGRFNFVTLRANGIYYLTAGQVLKVRAYADVNTATNWTLTGGAYITNFSGFLVSRT